MNFHLFNSISHLFIRITSSDRVAAVNFSLHAALTLTVAYLKRVAREAYSPGHSKAIQFAITDPTWVLVI